ncbi:MAG: uncharacterized protein K0R26_1103 [Bacteroidota bacterium]|jgi:hypothetical protein|nr:uncharacterized protein [Bacteroidota bacterium]
MPGEVKTDQSSYGNVSADADILVIELLPSTVSFCELNAAAEKPLWLTHHSYEEQTQTGLSDALLQMVKHHRLAEKTYQHVYINYFEKQFTLCPATFYNEESSRTLLEFNTGTTGDKLIITDDLNSDIKLMYSIDEHLKSTLDRLFPQHLLKHTLTIQSRILLHSEELAKEDILLSIHASFIEVVVKQDQKFLLANQFSVSTEEDILYYVLFILEQYQLNPLTVKITLTGNLPSESGIVSVLKKYIKNIRLGIGHKSINWSNLAGLPQHHNYTLLNRMFCE